MAQLKRHSLLESIANIGVGIGVAFISQVVIFPLYGIHVNVNTNIEITLWFTAISLIRQYVLRRWFTKRTE